MKTEYFDISEIVIEKSLNYLNYILLEYNFIEYKNKDYKGQTSYNSCAYYFQNKKKNLIVTIDITKSSINNIILFCFIKKYNGQEECEGNINLSEYFRQYKKIDYRDHFILSDYPGDTFEEKLDHFFAWLSSVTDEKLIKIFKGEDWVEVPYDWGDEK